MKYLQCLCMIRLYPPLLNNSVCLDTLNLYDHSKYNHNDECYVMLCYLGMIKSKHGYVLFLV